MTTHATTPTEDVETDTSATGYQLCEFCRATGKANNAPDSVCACHPITRQVAGPSSVNTKYDQIIQTAETAVIDHWGAFWDDSVTITKSILRGQSGDEYTVHIEFDGTLTSNLSQLYETTDATAQLQTINGDGVVHVGVTLTNFQE